MSWFKANTSGGRLLYSIVILTLVTMGFCIFLSTTQSVDANSGSKGANLVPEATFQANSATLGGIPDSDVSSPACQNNSTTSRDVTFTVSGLTGSVSSVSVNFSAFHSYLQDVEVTLIAPSAQQLLLFSATGTTSTTANACGPNSNDLSTSNTYTFADTASANWWTSAAAGNPVPSATSRTVVSGIGGVPSGVPTTTSLNSTFAAATPNGTWTLRFRDRGAGDTGSVNAASLTITTSAVVAPTQHVVDYDGDGKTDFSTIRNIGVGAAGQLRWFNANNGTGATTAIDWGLGSDFFVPCDFDGDHKSDVAVWRPSSPGNSFFYILQSQTSTLRIVNFGQSNDDPTVVGDYDGDGKCDPAVYRPGVNPGDQSTWYYLGSLNNPSGNITYVPWGSNGDFPAPGDYDGDGKNDFVIQRADGGNARFWELLSSGSINNSNLFGLATDIIVPGDFDADGKTDLSIVRGAGNGTFEWWQKLSSNGAIQATQFGSSQDDFVTPGDYDGDGKTDIAVWRPDPAAPGVFWYTKSGSGGAIGTFQFGSFGDYPLANSNTH